MENFKNELDYYCDIKNHDITCFMDLGTPIDEKYIEANRKRNGKDRTDCYCNLMDDLEAQYALKLLELGLTLYREPRLKDCSSRPDFYVYNEELQEGVLVEITQYKKNNNSKKKGKQHQNISEFSHIYGIPFIPLFREDLEMMGLHTL